MVSHLSPVLEMQPWAWLPWNFTHCQMGIKASTMASVFIKRRSFVCNQPPRRPGTLYPDLPLWQLIMEKLPTDWVARSGSFRVPLCRHRPASHLFPGCVLLFWELCSVQGILSLCQGYCLDKLASSIMCILEKLISNYPWMNSGGFPWKTT